VQLAGCHLLFEEALFLVDGWTSRVFLRSNKTGFRIAAGAGASRAGDGRFPAI